MPVSLAKYFLWVYSAVYGQHIAHVTRGGIVAQLSQ